MRITFDIESEPLPESELILSMPAFDADSVKTGNIKDEKLRSEKLIKCEQDHKTNYLKDAALSAVTGKVLLIGISNRSPFHGDNEAELLERFWNFYFLSSANGEIWTGWNIFNFDLPFLIRRSWKHGVSIPANVRNGRYWGSHFIDLIDVWRMGEKQGGNTPASLDAVAKYFGLAGKLGSGKDFAALYRSNQAEALAYVSQDLSLTNYIADKLLGA